jgi:hypothetical protein
VVKKGPLILVGVVVALVAALLFWPRWPSPRDHVALVSLVMSSLRSEIAALCLAGKPFTEGGLQAAGLEPRFRPTVLRRDTGVKGGKFVTGERRVPAEEIEEATIRIESPQRLVLTLTLPEVRSGFKPFDSVAIPKGSTITVIAECKERMIHWSTDSASTTVSNRYLTPWMREGLR